MPTVETLKTPMYRVLNGVEQKILVETSADQVKMQSSDVESLLGGILTGESIPTSAGLTHDSDHKIAIYNDDTLQFDSQNRVGVAPGAGLTTDSEGKVAINVGDGLAFDTDSTIKVFHDSTLVTDSDTGSIGVAIGSGLHLNESTGAIENDNPIAPLCENITFDTSDWVGNVATKTIPGAGSYNLPFVVPVGSVNYYNKGITFEVGAEDVVTFTATTAPDSELQIMFIAFR